MICDLPLDKKFIVIHYLLNRYKNKYYKYNNTRHNECNYDYICQLNKLLTKIVESNVELTNYSKETINNALKYNLKIKKKNKKIKIF